MKLLRLENPRAFIHDNFDGDFMNCVLSCVQFARWHGRDVGDPEVVFEASNVDAVLEGCENLADAGFAGV